MAETKQEVKHTALPWHAWDRGIGWEVSQVGSDNPINDGFRETFKRADAELIVRAVNSHALLVDALIKCKDKALLAIPMAIGLTQDDLQEIADVAKAALQAAKQGRVK